MDDKKLKLLQHTLGAEKRYPKKTWGFRNYYLAADCDKKLLDELVSDGFMWKGAEAAAWLGGGAYYHATQKGMRAAGLSVRRIKEISDVITEIQEEV